VFENRGPENGGPENAGPTALELENARPNNFAHFYHNILY